MLNHYFAMFLHMLPPLLGLAVLILAAIGFWRGLSLRPHEPENRPGPPPFWWWWSRW